MAKKHVRLGFIGGGAIARFQMERFKKVPGVEIVAVADINASALKKCKKQYAISGLYRDWRELIALRNVDAVSVCTPNNLHKEPTIAALRAGKHVLVEKPMAMNAVEAQAMVNAARKSRKLLQIGFQWRFLPAAQLLRKECKAGNFGKILYVRCQALRRRGIPSWGVFGRKELQGGGPLIDIGVHVLEMAHYIMGSPRPVAVRGACYTYLGNKKPSALGEWGAWDYKTYNVEDLAIGFVSFADGSTLVIESSFAAHIEKEIHNIQIMGTKSGATLDPLRIYRDVDGKMINMKPALAGRWDNFEYKLKHFIECIRDGKKCDAPGEDGVVVQKIIDAIYRSARLGREVRLK